MLGKGSTLIVSIPQMPQYSDEFGNPTNLVVQIETNWPNCPVILAHQQVPYSWYRNATIVKWVRRLDRPQNVEDTDDDRTCAYVLW